MKRYLQRRHPVEYSQGKMLQSVPLPDRVDLATIQIVPLTNERYSSASRSLTMKSGIRAISQVCFAVAASLLLIPPASCFADTLITSFETPEQMNVPAAYGATLFRSPIHGTDGDWSALVTFDGSATARLHFENRTSWWNVSSLSFDATTEEATPLPLRVVVHTGSRNFVFHLQIRPNRDAKVNLPVDAITRGAQDQVDAGAYSYSGEGRPALLNTVTGFDIALDAPSSGQHQFYLDNVRLVNTEDGKGPQMVDALGQYAPADWPGKMNQPEALLVDAAQEPVQLAGEDHPHLDQYGAPRGGGFRQSPFFTLSHRNAGWKLVDPEGNGLFALGVDGVSLHGDEAPPGPVEMYASRPLRSGMQAFYEENIQAKYGTDFQAAWRRIAEKRLRHWNFNLVGFGSDALRMPRVIEAGSSSQLTGVHHLGPFADPYDPTFLPALRQALLPLAAQREDPWIVGYTFDHGLPWQKLLDAAFVMAHGGPAADALATRVRAAHPENSTPSSNDMVGFATDFATRYFNAVAMGIHEADRGHHLFLGYRLVQAPEPVIDACAHSADLLTIDAFTRTPTESPAVRYALERGYPVLISAFSFGATDRGLLSAGDCATADQAARAASYITFVEDCRKQPGIVGCLWHRYLDEPVLVEDRAGANSGLVTVVDRPYPELTAACRAENARAGSGLASDDIGATKTARLN